MFAFYDEFNNEILGYAESYLPCVKQDEGDDHPPHVHTPNSITIGGPYFCRGLPEAITYTLEKRE